MNRDCIIALDLGTTSFKCAPVNDCAVLADPVNVQYSLDYADGLVTCDADTYVQAAMQALTGALAVAQTQGWNVKAIGISSQAQTYLPLDQQGVPLQKAVVWTDGRAVDEAEEVNRAIPDFARHSGFGRALPGLFLPKVMHFARHNNIRLDQVWKFALLNEYIIYHLTSSVYGDTTNQGMSGFYHITKRAWSSTALTLAGVSPQQLAEVAPAAHIGRHVSPEIAGRLGLDPVPVYSCGNDQSSAAIGAGLQAEGEVLCNFGTAMVVYAMKDVYPDELHDKQIAGINPLTGRFFLLGVESECGNVLDWAHQVLFAGRDFADMLSEALHMTVDPATLPSVRLPGGGRIEIHALTIGHTGKHLTRSLMELYADTFSLLLKDMEGTRQFAIYKAAGGLSHSDVWLSFLSRRCGIQFSRLETEQPGLIGIARIIAHARSGAIEMPGT